jgi:hypothetical protein
MNTALRYRCCAEANIQPESKRAELVELSAVIADEWYEANPMRVGSPQSEDRYHRDCAVHVGTEVRMKCGVFLWLMVFSYLLSICYTVWKWRRDTNGDTQGASNAP